METSRPRKKPIMWAFHGPYKKLMVHVDWDVAVFSHVIVCIQFLCTQVISFSDTCDQFSDVLTCPHRTQNISTQYTETSKSNIYRKKCLEQKIDGKKKRESKKTQKTYQKFRATTLKSDNQWTILEKPLSNQKTNGKSQKNHQQMSIRIKIIKPIQSLFCSDFYLASLGELDPIPPPAPWLYRSVSWS